MAAVCSAFVLLPAAAHAGSHFKPCTDTGVEPPFVDYDVGANFEGLQLSERGYECDRPTRPPEPISRNDISLFSYGDCQAPCASPLEVSTRPACDTWWGQYNLAIPDTPVRRPKLRRMRGVPAVRMDGGHQVELYTGDVTVTIFGNARARVKRAVKALRRARGGGPGDGGPLPSPIPGALLGKITCGFRFDGLAITTREADDGPRAVVAVSLHRKGYVEVELERRDGGQWISDGQAIYRAREGKSHHGIAVRRGEYRATVVAWDHKGHRTRVRTLEFRTPD
jgi:hypothetical protein